MDRRLAGALLVMAVLAVAVVMPLLGGRRITGLAEPVAVPRDPRMGDCLLQMPEGIAPALPRSGSSVSTAATPAAVSLPLGPRAVSCRSSAVAAEVVLTITAAGDIETRQRKVARTGIDCHEAALRYAGLTRSAEGFRPASMTPGQAADDPVSWRMSINIRTAWVYPSPFLRSQGRIWAACVVAPPSDVPYTGSLADAFTSGRLPDGYGTCWSSTQVSAGTAFTSCHQPHVAELISVGSAGPTADSASLRASCERLAALTMGRTDPTAGGALSVKTSPPEFSVADENRSNNVVCYITSSDRQLVGTLMGLHDSPVPFGG